MFQSAVGMHRLARPVSRFAALGRVLAALGTTAAAWLVVVTHLTTALHFALISHEICAAHGELVHGSSLLRPHATTGGTEAALPAGEQEGHEHCPVLSRRVDHHALFEAPGARLPPVAFDRATVSSHDDAVVTSRAELLLVAPKQSPPS